MTPEHLEVTDAELETPAANATRSAVIIPLVKAKPPSPRGHVLGSSGRLEMDLDDIEVPDLQIYASR